MPKKDREMLSCKCGNRLALGGQPLLWIRLQPVKRHDPACKLDDFETKADADSWRKKRSHMFRSGRNANLSIAETLADCTYAHPCGSPACPSCMRQFRRYISGAFCSLLDEIGWSKGTGYAVTAVPNWAVVTPGELVKFDMNKANIRVRKVLERSNIRDALVVGGWDFSCNSSSSQSGTKFWQPHLYLLFPLIEDKEELRAALTRCFPSSELNPRPIYIEVLSDPLEAITYAFKGVFKLRTSYTDDNGRRNTRSRHRLPAPLERELLTYLDNTGMTDRMFLRNVRRRGCRLVANPRDERNTDNG
jgi:hypothetical protein